MVDKLRKLLIGLSAVLFGFWPTLAFAAWPSSSRYTGVPTFNILSFGGVCNGIANDGPAFKAVGDAMRAFQAANNNLPVTLLIPPGSTCLETTCPGPPGGFQFGGIYNMTILATGASVTQSGAGLCIGWTTAQDKTIGGGATPYFRLFNSSIAGATCVTMTTPGQEALFPAGRWVLIGGDGVQTNSFPPNYANWEYAQIDHNGSGQVCFTAPLANAYPSTGVADLHLADCSNWSCGGQGSLNLLTPEWGGYFHTIGLTFSTGNAAEISWGARTTINDNLTFLNGGVNCYAPSVSQTVTFINPHIPCVPEVDKELGQIVVNGGSLISFLIQSGAAVKNITLNNGATAHFGGTPHSLNCNDSSIAEGSGLGWGNAYSALPQSFAGVNCQLSSGFLTTHPPFFEAITIPDSSCTAGGNTTYDGAGHIVITHIDVYGGCFPQWLSVGAHMAVLTQNSTSILSLENGDSAFTVSAVAQSNLTTDATLTITMSPSPGATLPPVSGGTVTAFGYQSDVASNTTCTGCGGSPDFTDLNFPAAQNKPLFTYSNRIYTCANNIVNVPGSLDINTDPGFFMTGTFVSYTINVITADTNGADASPTMFFTTDTYYNTATGVASNGINQSSTNLKLTGTRVLTPTTVTGAQAGDGLTPPGANTWFAAKGNGNNTFGITNGPAAQCPVVNVEWQTTR